MVDIDISQLKEQYQDHVYTLTTDEFDSLKSSISRNGVQVPIIINYDNIILDGHHRVKACRQLRIKSIPVIMKRFRTKQLEEAFVIGTNLERRQLNDFQKAELFTRLHSLESARAKARQKAGRKSTVASKGAKGKTSEIVAKKAGMSTKTYERASYIIKHADEHTKARLRASELSITDSYNFYRRKAKRAEVQQQVPTNPPADFMPMVGDFREKCKTIPDNSIALIFTDPPYETKYLEYYKDLANIASRVLIDGGSLLTFYNQAHLKAVYNMLESSGLVYHWQVAVIHSGYSSAYHQRNVTVTWKPMLWFRKGAKLRTTDGYIKDSVVSKPPDKDAHDWAQSPVEAEHFIKYLTVVGDDILDPFLGSGTTGLAALKLKRRFLGIDLDEKQVNQASLHLGRASLRV